MQIKLIDSLPQKYYLYKSVFTFCLDTKSNKKVKPIRNEHVLQSINHSANRLTQTSLFVMLKIAESRRVICATHEGAAFSFSFFKVVKENIEDEKEALENSLNFEETFLIFHE